MPIHLYHVSAVSGIARFEPRPSPSPGQDGEMVWAIDDEHLHNYLLPRDCPRVTFYARPESDPADIEKLMAGSSSRYVVAIEAKWLEAVRRERLTLYTLPGETFLPADVGAGYYTSRQPVEPVSEEHIEDILSALLGRDVELRIMPSLWKLRDLVIDSTLQFSIIRFRNAQQQTSSSISRGDGSILAQREKSGNARPRRPVLRRPNKEVT